MGEKHFSANALSLLSALTNLPSQPSDKLQFVDNINYKTHAVLKFVQILLHDSVDASRMAMAKNADTLLYCGMVLYDHLGPESFTKLVEAFQTKTCNNEDLDSLPTPIKELIQQIIDSHSFTTPESNSHQPNEPLQRTSSTSSNLMLKIGPDCNWVSLNNKHLDFRRRGSMRRILLRLVEHRHSKQALTSFALIDAGWPSGNKIPPTSAITRLYTTISRMRSIGLRDYIESYDGGYALAAQVVVIRETPGK